MIAKQARIMVMAAACGLALAGCSLYSEGNVSSNRVQVQEKDFVQEIRVREMDKKQIAGLSRAYDNHGSGPFDVTVTYDPISRNNTAMQATNEAARLASAFRKEGLKDVHTNILPVNEQGEESVVIVSFLSYDALAPKDCGVMDGYESTQLTASEDYKLGCTVDTVFARQIARPKDLKGQGVESDKTEGRSASNIVDTYRAGAPLDALEGQTASED